MKFHITDNDALQAIKPMALAAYVRAEGWTRVEAYGEFSDVYSHGSNEILLPNSEYVADYASVIADALRRLSTFEGRSEIQLYRDLSVADCDVVRNRSSNAENDGSISVDEGVALFVHVKELLLSAACAAKEPKAMFRAGGIKDATDYMNRVRLGQTEQGSFIISLIAPVPMNFSSDSQGKLWPEKFKEPYERQVTRTLVDGLEAAKKAAVAVIQGGTQDVFRRAINKGLSVNSCNALAHLTESGDGADLSVTWARTRPAPEARSRVQFTTAEGEIFREAARYLREVEPRFDERIDAFVVKLDRGPTEMCGKITLKTYLDQKPVSIITSLPPSEYELASQANNEKVTISLKGDLIKRGQRWHLENPRDLKLIEEEFD
ncbi:MAG: hypothetical protein GX413_12650 [Acetobacter sp.]|nr:hypothetical protein [Acetobacter sp.]